MSERMVNTDPEAKVQEKTFTQSEVDEIIKSRLSREHRKTDDSRIDELNNKEKELEQRELRADARDKLKALGLPESISELVNFNSKEEYETTIEKVIASYNEVSEKARENAVKSLQIQPHKLETGDIVESKEDDMFRNAFNDSTV